MLPHGQPVFLLCCSGSVACIKVPEIALVLQSQIPEVHIVVVPTVRAQYFLPRSSTGSATLFEGSTNSKIHLANPNGERIDNWSAVMTQVIGCAIAPLGANLMAKLATTGTNFPSGGALLEQVLNKYLDCRKSNLTPFFVAPAMNSMMWNSQITRNNLECLKKRFEEDFWVIPTANKASMCGETGFGPMASPEEIKDHVLRALKGTPMPIGHDQIFAPRPMFDFLQKTASSAERVLDFSRNSDYYRLCLKKVVESLKLEAETDAEESVRVLVGVDNGTSSNDFQSRPHLTKDECIKTFDSLLEPFFSDLHALANERSSPDVLKVTRKYISDDKFRALVPALNTTMPENAVDALQCFSDSDEWQLWKKRSDPVLHIALRQWASVLLLVNPSATLIQKILDGRCDDLLTCTIRAWDYGTKGMFAVFFDPSVLNGDMETANKLESMGIKVVII